MKHLNEILSDASTEEELKFLFAKFFGLKLSTKNYIDLYTPQILFEFKFDAPLKNLHVRADIVAQTLYYVRRLKFGKDIRAVSENICVVSKTAAAFFKTDGFDEFIRRKTYDWDLAPSSPCKKLVAELAAHYAVKAKHVYDFADAEDTKNFVELIKRNLSVQIVLDILPKDINENNFYQIFLHWQKIFGAAVENGHKSSEYFVTDIEQGKSEIVGNGVLFNMSDGEYIKKFLNLSEYKYFWRVYEKIRDPRIVIAIRQKMDRMTEINLRRFTGEFFTPLAFAEKAVDYLRHVVGENCWRTGKFRLWDMAAGTGNLEFALPEEARPYCYISTLLDDDADYCRNIFKQSTVFQYDYLNDDVNFFGHEQILEGLGVKRKMPQKLVDDLKNPELRWIIFINPPYATANNKQLTNRDIDKSNVSMTAVRKLMTADDMGETSRELFSQFLYRISRDFADRQAWLGIFSTPKYINSNNDQQLRDKFFAYRFERGFVFSSQNFQGCNGKFSVGFLVWKLGEHVPLEAQEILLDVYNSTAEKIAVKTFRPARRDEFLSKWIERPPARKIFPPLSGALNVAAQNKDRRDRVAENFLASLTVKGNEFSNQTYTSILSGPYVSAGALSVTPDNFEQCMVVHMARRLPKATWLNDRDQFMQPTKKLTPEFISDAVVWSLFVPSNQTVSLRDVEYEGEIYRMPNNFFPFKLAEVRRWECSSPTIRMQLARATEDRFAATWLAGRELSTAAREVLAAGREIYKLFYNSLDVLEPACQKFKITDWDVGWYQIRMATNKFFDGDYAHIQIAIKNLSAKLLPQIYEFGFLRDEVRYF